MNSVKDEAQKLVDQLPDSASWDDLMYAFYIRKKVDSGLKAAEEGDILSHEEVRQRFIRR